LKVKTQKGKGNKSLSFCKPSEEQLINILRYSGESLSGPELGSRLGLSDRQVRALIAHFRKDHCIPICSTPRDGFYWPRTPRSADETIASIHSRINEMKAVIDGIETGMSHMFTQMNLFGEAV
jgi:biotin operon repressor